jgi:hypothetical protein
MSNALKIIEQDPLQTRASEARAHIVDLAQDVDQKRFDLDKAETKYCASREPMDRLERDCAKDRLQDAESALSAQREAYAPLFAEADRELKVEELAKLSERLKPGEFATRKGRIADIMAAARRDLRGALLELSEAVVESNKLRSRARNLAQTLGAPDFYALVTLDDLVNQIAPVPTSYSGALPVSLRCFSTNGSERERRFVFEVNNLLHGGDQ